MLKMEIISPKREIKMKIEGRIPQIIQGNFQEKIAKPSIEIQEILPDDRYDALSKVIIEAVNSEIDDNIISENIKDGVEILGVVGNYDNRKEEQSKSIEITQNGVINVYPDDNKVLNEVNINANVLPDTSDATATADDIASGKIAYIAEGKVVGQFEMPKIILKYVGSGTMADNSFELYIDEDVPPYAFQTSNSTGWFNISKVVTENNCKIINTRAFSSQQKCKLFDFRKGVTDLETLCFNNSMTEETKIVLGEQFKRVSGQVFYEAPAYVYCYSITPPSLGTFNFYRISLLKAIYVPDESVDLYKNATNWTTVADYIKPLSEAEVI